MKKRFTAWLLVVPLALLLGCATQIDDAEKWLQRGPHSVASDEAVLSDPAQNRDVSFLVYWPDGPGPFPLVAFSSGAFCYPQQYINIVEHWVSHGYVVVLPNHLDSPNLGKLKPSDIAILLDSRVADMSFVLDSAAALESNLPELQGRIDWNRAAAAGHSFGGMIAMVKTGLRMQTADGTVLTDWPDPRFQAAVVMSGVGQVPQNPRTPQINFMTDDAFDGLSRPLLANGGTLDEGNVGTGVVYPWEWRMSPYTLAPAGDKYGLVLEEADHYLGGLICRDNRGGPDDPGAVALISAVQTAFLDAYLLDDESARRWLRDTDFTTISNGRAKLEYK